VGDYFCVRSQLWAGVVEGHRKALLRALAATHLRAPITGRARLESLSRGRSQSLLVEGSSERLPACVRQVAGNQSRKFA